jgi:sugar/nucleoside kinase (ribokinase family)
MTVVHDATAIRDSQPGNRERQDAMTDKTPPQNDAPSGRKDQKKPLRREPFRNTDRQRSPSQLTRTPDYLVIGHISADLQPDGSVVLGGTALYSAITAARLGARVAVLTRGVYGREVAGMNVPSIESALSEDIASRISIVVQQADIPTTFINVYQADRRVQTLPHWAGPIDLRGIPPHWRNSNVVHLGPIADEVEPRQATGLTSQFVGATPQGWMRDWPRGKGGPVKNIPLRLPGELISRLDCVIVSIEEITYSRDVVEKVGARRLGVVTMDRNGARVIAGGKTLELGGYKVNVRDATGAGDVFAAGFFLKASDRTISAETAGKFANAVAALSLQEIGSVGIPTVAEVEKLLADNA